MQTFRPTLRPRRPGHFVSALAALSLAAACGVEAGDASADGADDSFVSDGKADAYGVAEGTYLAAAILEVASTTTVDGLRDEVGVAARTAREIGRAQARLGRRFLSLAELDAVPYTGRRFFDAMVAHVEAFGLEGRCGDGVVQPGLETCDEGGATDTCSATCRSPYAGPGEAYLKSLVPAADDFFGSGVAMSADGATVAVGAPCHGEVPAYPGDVTHCAGSVEIFRRVEGGWAHAALLEAPAPFDLDDDLHVGAQFALSADGTVLAVPLPALRTSAGLRGGVAIYERGAGGTWAYRTFLAGEGGAPLDAMSVALSGDGRTLAVVDSGAAGGGAVRVAMFRRDASGGFALHGYAEAFDDVEGIGFGHSVALSRDGTVLIVGAPFAKVETSRGLRSRGAVYVFEELEGAFLELDRVDGPATRPELEYRFEFGRRVALSADADVLAVSAPLAFGTSTTRGGWVQTLRRTVGGTYRPEATFEQPFVVHSGQLGAGLALSADGQTLLVGDPDYDAAYVYRRAGEGWDQVAEVTGAGAFGASGALDATGRRAVVGAPAESAPIAGQAVHGAGASWVFGPGDLGAP